MLCDNSNFLFKIFDFTGRYFDRWDTLEMLAMAVLSVIAAAKTIRVYPGHIGRHHPG
jgi:hypothetical protein